MPYNEDLAQRIREIIYPSRTVSERKMFGGICFNYNGKMWIGVNKNNLLIKVPKEDTEKFLKLKHTRPMDFTGKPLRGFIYVSKEGFKTKSTLKKWINLAESLV